MAFAALAGLCSLLAFLGWVINSPELRGFGVESRPIWPLTALGYLGLSLGFMAAIDRRPRTARAILAFPLLLAAISIVEGFWGIEIGTDRLLFPNLIVDYPFPHPGRPGPTPTTIFILLGGAGLTSIRATDQRNELAGVIASAGLGLAIATAILLLFSSPEDPLSKLYSISIPSATTAISLAASYVFWHSGFGWVKLLTSNRPGWRALQLLLPAALILPVIPSLLEVLIERADLISPVGSKLLVLLLNILLVALIVYWAVTRVAQEQSALLETLADLRKSEDRLRTAAAAHELGVFEWNVADGSFTWSPGTEQRLGVEPGSMPDFDSWVALVEPEDVQPMLDTVARAVAEKAERFSYRYRFREANGSVRSVEGSSRAFYDEAGNLIRTIGVILNVTERDEREAALRAREAQLRSIIASVPDAMVVVDHEGRIVEISPAAERLFGYDNATVRGRFVTIFATEDERALYLAAMKSFQATGVSGFINQVVSSVARASDGRHIPVEISTGAAISDGKVLFTTFYRDVSERLNTEQRLSELNDELAHVSRQSAMSELTADLAHELNQPLSAIANFLAAAGMLIDKGEDIDRVADLVRLGSEQTQRAGQIIRRLREFTARGEVEMHVEPVEETIRDSVDLVLVGSTQVQIRVSYDFDAEAQQMYADRIQVQQVMVNLLRNAIQAIRTLPTSQRQITITSRRKGLEMIEIEVADTGPGIPAHITDQLFSRFISTKGSNEGMGIGLSISKRIVEAHGGVMSAENRPEGGAAFRFTLPAVGEGVND